MDEEKKSESTQRIYVEDIPKPDIKAIRQKTALLGSDEFTSKKNRFKTARTVFQIFFVGLCIFTLINLFFTLKTYEPYSPNEVNNSSEDTGFVALSYFGVDRIGNTATLIGRDQLRRHLTAMRNQGYVTITQSDIEAYYKNGKPLPKRALFLMFEDGRRDTAIFAQDIMEDLNFKATMMTYPEKFDNRDTKFLLPDDLKELESSSFWENGTNGYRLQYINVFDRYDNYIGEIDPLKYAMISRYLRRGYNHYLMDYLRDKDNIPRESYEHMKARLSYDYTRLRDLYQSELGYVPMTHVLMHANTGKFGNNNDASAVNEKWIRELFAMNFNREGYSFNQRNSSVYDLTRMQPQPFWAVNHLLMRIKYDINQPIEFIQGDVNRQQMWTLVEGASEIRDEQMILTTLPEGVGRVKLNNSRSYGDIQVETALLGNAFGSQQILLRASDDLSSFICVALVNDQLEIKESFNGNIREIYRERLSTILGEYVSSVEEDRRDAIVRENETFARYATSPEMTQEYMARRQAALDMPVKTVADGAEAYIATQEFNKRGSHVVHISLKGDGISVEVDGKPAADNLPVSNQNSGNICLGASWSGDAWSQRNLADDVYDAVFDRLRVTTNTGKSMDEETLLYSLELTGIDKVLYDANKIFESVLEWFLDKF